MQIYSEKEKRNLLLEFESSDESVIEFCRRKKIKENTFYYWRTCGRKKKLGIVKPKLLPVVCQKEEETLKTPIDGAELALPRGMILRFLPGTSVRYISSIIASLV